MTILRVENLNSTTYVIEFDNNNSVSRIKNVYAYKVSEEWEQNNRCVIIIKTVPVCFR